jgi:hypothetical protein
MWDRWVAEKIEECVGRFTLACSLCDTDDYFVWAFGEEGEGGGGVYGLNDDGDRWLLWDELAGWEMPWYWGRFQCGLVS